MRKTEKNLKVSCTECIHRRRILTCHENGRDCTLCKNACCCRKCNPDASGQELEYEQRKYFSPGMPMSEYIQLKKTKTQTVNKAISGEIDDIKNKLQDRQVEDNTILVKTSEGEKATLKPVVQEQKNNESETTEHTNIVEQDIGEPTNRKIKKKKNVKKSTVQQEKQEVADNLTTDKNGQLSFLWD